MCIRVLSVCVAMAISGNVLAVTGTPTWAQAFNGKIDNVTELSLSEQAATRGAAGPALVAPMIAGAAVSLAGYYGTAAVTGGPTTPSGAMLMGVAGAVTAAVPALGMGKVASTALASSIAGGGAAASAVVDGGPQRMFPDPLYMHPRCRIQPTDC